MQSELISVIVPVYNGEQSVARCIQSLIMQTYTNFEVIILNDGSTDNTEEVCLAYVQKDERIQYFSQNNMGVSLTRKKGLSFAKGKYISFVDSDDYVKKDYLEQLYNAIKRSKASVVCCNSIDSAKFSENMYIEEDLLITEPKTLFEAFFSVKRYAYCIWGKLFDRDVIVNIKFPKLKYAEDAYVVMSLFAMKPQVLLIQYAGYYYQDNPNGAMNNSLGIQQPIDMLYCSICICRKCFKLCPELNTQATNHLLLQAFSVLINSSVENANIISQADNLLKECFIFLDNHFLQKSVKGKVILMYKHFPQLTRKLLKSYRHLKHTVVGR